MALLYDSMLAFVGLLAALVFRLPRFREHRERLGFYAESTVARVASRPVVWVHNASVGELLASAPLVRALRARFPAHALVLSTTSLSGREIARTWPEADAAVLLPLDFRAAIRRALDAFRPSVVVFTETELWPSWLGELARRGIPAVLVSGRISPPAFVRYLRIRFFLRRVLSEVSFFGMQTEAEAGRIRALGAPAERVAVTGSLKLAPAPLSPGLGVEGDGLLWVAGSTHAGEEEACLGAFERLRSRFPRLRLVLAPRRVERCADVERLLEARGIGFVRRSALNGAWRLDPRVLVLDTLGELAALYRHAAVAFVGGTLVRVGGHNLVEPARAGVPVLFGPYLGSVAEVAARLERSGGGKRVSSEADLESEVARLLDDAGARSEMGRRARETFAAEAVATTSADAVARFLEAP